MNGRVRDAKTRSTIRLKSLQSVGRKSDNRRDWCLAEVDLNGDDRPITKLTPAVRAVMIQSLESSIACGGHQFGLLSAGRVLRGLRKAELIESMQADALQRAAQERLLELADDALG